MSVVETRCVDQCHKAIIDRIEVGEFLDFTGLRLLSVTDDDILVTSESLDELKVFFFAKLTLSNFMSILTEDFPNMCPCV